MKSLEAYGQLVANTVDFSEPFYKVDDWSVRLLACEVFDSLKTEFRDLEWTKR